jgi:hypothetical protein
MRGDGSEDRGGPERYGFLSTVLERHGADLSPDPERLARWQNAYAAVRRVIHSEVFNEGEVPGYRAFAYQGGTHDVFFVGIRDDGVCVSGQVPYTTGTGKTPLYRPGVELDNRAKGAALCRVAAATVAGAPVEGDDTALVEPFGLNWDNTRPSTWFSFQTRARDFAAASNVLAERVLEATLGADRPGFANALVPPAPQPDPDEEIPFDDGQDVGLDKHARASYRVLHALRGPMAAQQRKAGRFVVALLSRAADPAALRRLRGLSISTPMAYNMLVGVPTLEEGDGTAIPAPRNATPVERFAGLVGAPSADLARNRNQAVATYPLFARTLLDGTGIDKRVDAGLPFEPELAERSGVPLAVLRRFRGASWQKVGRRAFHETNQVLSNYAGLAPEHVPTTQAGFRALDAAVAAAQGYVRSFPESPRTVASIVASLGGRFDKAAQWRDGADPDGASDAAQDVMARVVRPMVYQEALGMGMPADKALALATSARSHRRIDDDNWGWDHSAPAFPGFNPLGKDPGIRRAAEVTQGWHRAMFRIEAECSDPSVRPSNAWEPLFTTRELGGGWTAKEVRDPATMRMVGAAEGHCVAGYAPKAEEGRCIIVELCKDGNRVSVMEVATDQADPKQWQIAQNRGRANADPGKEAIAAGQRLLRGLRKTPSETWVSHRVALVAAVDERRKAASTRDPVAVLAQQVGYDPKDKDRADKAFGMLHAFMDPAWSKLDSAAFRARVVRPFVVEMEAASVRHVEDKRALEARRAARNQSLEEGEDAVPAAAPARPNMLARAAAAVRGVAR